MTETRTAAAPWRCLKIADSAGGVRCSQIAPLIVPDAWELKFPMVIPDKRSVKKAEAELRLADCRAALATGCPAPSPADEPAPIVMITTAPATTAATPTPAKIRQRLTRTPATIRALVCAELGRGSPGAGMPSS